MKPTATDDAACRDLEHQLAALKQLLAAELGGVVGLDCQPPRPLNVADLLVLCELYFEGRAMGVERLPALKLAAAQLWTGIEKEFDP